MPDSVCTHEMIVDNDNSDLVDIESDQVKRDVERPGRGIDQDAENQAQNNLDVDQDDEDENDEAQDNGNHVHTCALE